LPIPRFISLYILRNSAVLRTRNNVRAQTSPSIRPAHHFRHDDGLRWQEVFNGAEESLMNKKERQGEE